MPVTDAQFDLVVVGSGFFGLTILPMAYSLYLSFTRYNIFQPPRWIGIDNYVRLFTNDPQFIQSAQITLADGATVTNLANGAKSLAVQNIASNNACVTCTGVYERRAEHHGRD